MTMIYTAHCAPNVSTAMSDHRPDRRLGQKGVAQPAPCSSPYQRHAHIKVVSETRYQQTFEENLRHSFVKGRRFAGHRLAYERNRGQHIVNGSTLNAMSLRFWSRRRQPLRLAVSMFLPKPSPTWPVWV